MATKKKSHSGKSKVGLNQCGRLKKGYKFKKGGAVVKVTKKPVKRKTTKKK